MDGSLWWRNGVIYQVYPRSFFDRNGDGLGDLPGIISKLDYLVDLGVDAVWLSPFYPSPNVDFGYDISDHAAVDPSFGSLDDFDRLVSAAHQRGLRIVLDLVLNHTSDQHPWFQASRSSRHDPRRDWYIWRDLPNNWQARFGSSAWQYDDRTGQYYLHLFAKEQPDLNWRNPDVRQAQMDVVRFWLARGVDGFRLDVFNAYFKEASFQDNPPAFGLLTFDRQKHIHDIDQPEMLPFLGELRALLDDHPHSYAVGETHIATLEKCVRYCGRQALHAAFSFDFMSLGLIPSYPWQPRWLMKRLITQDEAFKPHAIWPTLVMSNHDQPRAASRYSRGSRDEQAFLAMALLLTARGTPFIYYGEEIGMRDLHLGREEIMDPIGKRYYPLYKGRDGCRTPMQWDSSPHGGFTTGKPWLRLNPDFVHRNVDAQKADPGSVLNFTRSLLALRKRMPALHGGSFIPLESHRGVMLTLRRKADQSVLVALNFRSVRRRFSLPPGEWRILLATAGGVHGVLAPYEVQVLELVSKKN
jgi:alpha-glucosidase